MGLQWQTHKLDRYRNCVNGKSTEKVWGEGRAGIAGQRLLPR